MEIQIHCSFDEMVPVKDIKPNPNNRNHHPKEQIERLAKILEYQGLRHPLIISKNSGLLVVGHGRLAALKKLKCKKVPVKYQEFIDAEQEYAFAVSDNAVSLWAELDLSGINTDLADLGPDFDLDNLGIKNFTLDPNEVPEEEPEEEKEASVENFNEKIITCPNCEVSFVMPKGNK